jgi:hypothetical protein
MFDLELCSILGWGTNIGGGRVFVKTCTWPVVCPLLNGMLLIPVNSMMESSPREQCAWEAGTLQTVSKYRPQFLCSDIL